MRCWRLPSNSVQITASRARTLVGMARKLVANGADVPAPAAEPAAKASKRGRAGKLTAAAAPAAAARDEVERPAFYLMKSEPDEFSIDDLAGKPGSTEQWDGVRNHLAKNIMRSMRKGELAFYYHSSCAVPGIVGLVEVVREAYPDHTAWTAGHEYHDAKTDKDNPTWHMVDVRLVRRLKRQITLEELKGHKEGALSDMALFNHPRLSVQPVGRQHWDFILGLEGQPAPPPSSAKGGKKAAAAGEQGGRDQPRQAAAAAGGKKGSSAGGSKPAAKQRKGSAAAAAAGEEGE